MLKALQFVQGVISKKNMIPALTHFCIRDGRVMGSNGMLTLSSPLNLKMAITPKAVPFIQAIYRCKGTVSLSLTENGTLLIRSGAFKAHIECTTDPYPDFAPEGELMDVPENFIQALRLLEVFVADDDSRRWARGVLFRGESAFATNNIILTEYWLGKEFPCEVCIPDPAIKELLRINQTPQKMQVHEDSLTFHFEDGRWLRTQTFAHSWPPVETILDQMDVSNLKPIDPELFASISSLLAFSEELDRVFFRPGVISTTPTDEAGASIDFHAANKGIYNGRQILHLQGIANSIDFESYPNPSPWFGTNMRGLLAGMKL